jgi:hypothetical protein
MCRRLVYMAGVLVMTCVSSGCGLLCDRYCERERDRCEHYYNRGGCSAPPVPVPACPPGCAPAVGSYYAQPQHE